MHPKRGGTIRVYVKSSFHWTSEISRVLASACLGFVAAAALAILFGATLRLLLPAGFEAANLELARYKQAVGPAGVTAEGLRYVTAWRDMRRRSYLAMSFLLGGFGLLMLTWAFFPEVEAEAKSSMPYLVAAWFVLGMGSMIWAALSRCPRCGNRYSSKADEHETATFCTHCGLPLNSPPTTAVAPEFPNWKKRH